MVVSVARILYVRGPLVGCRSGAAKVGADTRLLQIFRPDRPSDLSEGRAVAG